MLKGLAFVERFTPDKLFDLSPEDSLPSENVETVPVSQAEYMMPTNFTIWLTPKWQSHYYPWWIADNYHMINDCVGGDPIWVGL